MGRSVIDLPPKVIHECVSVNENALHWDKYAVVSQHVPQLVPVPALVKGVKEINSADNSDIDPGSTWLEQIIMLFALLAFIVGGEIVVTPVQV